MATIQEIKRRIKEQKQKREDVKNFFNTFLDSVRADMRSKNSEAFKIQCDVRDATLNNDGNYDACINITFDVDTDSAQTIYVMVEVDQDANLTHDQMPKFGWAIQESLRIGAETFKLPGDIECPKIYYSEDDPANPFKIYSPVDTM